MANNTLSETIPLLAQLPTLARDADNNAVATYNQQLIDNLKRQLELQPSANILELIPRVYHDHWSQKQEFKRPEKNLSKLGKLNEKTLSVLTKRFNTDPEFDMITPGRYKLYSQERSELNPPSTFDAFLKKNAANINVQEEIERSGEPARVIYALSPELNELLEQHAERDLSCHKTNGTNGTNSLTNSFKKLIHTAQHIAQMGTRGAILKLNNNIIAKVIKPRESHDHAEYLSLLYLATNLPDFPSPKPHGFIQIGKFQVLLMSYIPSTRLTEVWSHLSNEEKAGLRSQIGDNFARLRRLQEPDGKPIGSLEQHIVKERRRFEEWCPRKLNSVEEHEDWRWSFAPRADPVFVQFLRGFLKRSSQHVFSHGDLSTENIMVKEDSSSKWVLSGIIDWEHSGFYPESFECQTVAIEHQPGDWSMWLPDCISPAKFPLEWLVNRYLTILQLNLPH
ncbi:MAG: hypothetical protein Q9227_000265 [Pyrenula ochraceoflavens]